MFVPAIGSIPDGVLEVGAVAVFALLLTVLAHRVRSRRAQTPRPGTTYEGRKSGKSVLWGVAPQDFDGPVARELRTLQALPARNDTSTPVDPPDIDELVSNCAAEDSFSALRVIRTPKDRRGKEPEGIIFALRLDCTRPDRLHASQAGWHENTSDYGFDEWIEHDGRLYNCGALWVDMTDTALAPERHAMSMTLWPENVLARSCADMRIATSTAMSDGRSRYIVVQLVPTEGAETDVRATLWLDAASLLPRKVALAFKNADAGPFSEVTTFAAYGTSASIDPPDWLNGKAKADGSFVVLSEKVCVVEHW